MLCLHTLGFSKLLLMQGHLHHPVPIFPFHRQPGLLHFQASMQFLLPFTVYMPALTAGCCCRSNLLCLLKAALGLFQEREPFTAPTAEGCGLPFRSEPQCIAMGIVRFQLLAAHLRKLNAEAVHQQISPPLQLPLDVDKFEVRLIFPMSSLMPQVCQVLFNLRKLLAELCSKMAQSSLKIISFVVAHSFEESILFFAQVCTIFCSFCEPATGADDVMPDRMPCCLAALVQVCLL
mmetsp:Transcript_126288/g.252313  ORF Transcript_126288/g.252313 Transcript_126288/m.252313 type:complete len:234 (+) Transcript_126288:561-1262(+)